METIEKHPSYGLLRFSRVAGCPQSLFGTHLNPQHFISMKLVEAECHKDDSRTNFYGHKNLVEVWLTASQFAELITSMGIGLGVPCTIRRLKDENIPFPPKQEIPTEKIQTYMKQRMIEFSGSIEDKIEDIKKILDKEGAINKKERLTIKDSINSALQEIKLNIPYFLEEFEEASEKILTNAKTEFDAFVTHAATSIGMEQIKKTGIRETETSLLGK